MSKKMIRNIIIAAASLVLVVGLILVIVFVPFGSAEDDVTEIDYGLSPEAKVYVNEQGLNCFEVQTNSKGELDNNSYGTLISKIPSEIEKISMSTSSGNYTFLLETPVNESGESEATIYTLEGFEDFELQQTNPSLLASAVCSVEFTRIADVTGENAADFGFDNPRAEATVYYTDGTYSVLRLGDEAAGGASCYVQFGDSKTVYIVAAEDLEPMLYEFTDLFSTAINGDATSISDDSFDKITLSGTHFSEEYVMVANTDAALSCYYVLSSHSDLPVSNTAGSNIMGSIKSLTADAVVCINPDAEDLAEYGLSNPYATVKTIYTYTDTQYDDDGTEISSEEKTYPVSLMASEKDSEGYVYLMEEDGKLIYKISSDSVYWATVTEDELRSEYVFSPSYSALDAVVITAAGKTYTFDMSTEEVTTTDEDGESTTATEITVSLDGNSINADQFYILCQDIMLLEVAGADESTATSGELLSITYKYTTGRADDTVVFYSTSSQKVIPVVNGERVGYVYKSHVEALVENVQRLSEGKEITAIA